MRIKHWLLLAAIVTAALSASGCNTVKGVGTDIHDFTQHVQNWLEGSTNDVTHDGTYAARGNGY